MRLLLLALAVLSAFAQSPADKAPDPEVKLEPLRTSITVRGRVEVPNSSYVDTLDAEMIESRPGVQIDDRLRDVPGFSLFRRSSSLAAHPTTQGVSLRGIGSNAASRTLVLLDGIPANDPFGGWVYWSRFNPDSIEEVQISRGPSTSVYGDRAMGGAVALWTPTPESRRIWTSAEGGTAGMADLRGGYSDLLGSLGVSTMLRAFRSEGYYVIQEPYRGPVDRRVDLDFWVHDLKLDYFRGKDQFSFKSNILAEQRQNGTEQRYNSTSLGTLAAHYRRAGLSVAGFHSRGALHSTFSSVNEARDFERLTTMQKVTSDDSGGSIVWERPTPDWNLILGADTRRSSGVSRDTVVVAGIVRTPGGRLWQQGLFAQTDFALGSRTRVYAGLRHDFTDRGNDFWSPRGGVAFQDGPRRWRASAYRSFRAPTLNEFFRQFSVGNIVTLPNSSLRPETMQGVDAGLDWRAGETVFRTTLFWQSIDDLIGNATIQTDPVPLRRRENFGTATGKGAEIEVQRAFRRVRLEAAYLYVDSRVEAPDLLGAADAISRWMPQTPRHQGSFQLLYSAGKTLFSGGIRSYALQFEDDLNQFVLPGFASVQLLVRRRLGHGVSALLAVENLLNRTYLAGFTPEPTTGTPRLFRVGLKWESGS